MMLKKVSQKLRLVLLIQFTLCMFFMSGTENVQAESTKLDPLFSETSFLVVLFENIFL